MSQFHPTNITLEPPPGPDYLAGAVLQGLARPIGAKCSWGVIKSLFLGIGSFGLLPILTWVRGFGAFATAEQQQLLHLAQWVRQNSVHPLARRLEEDAAEIRSRRWLSWLTTLTALATAGAIYLVIDQSRYLCWDRLIAGTFGYDRAVVLDRPVRRFADSQTVFALWFAGFGAAYVLHLLQVHLHARDVGRFVARFSEIAQSEGINRVRADSLGLGLRPLWIGAGVLMFAFGAPWGVVAMLAGAAQRRYITTTSRNTRADVAQRLRAMLLRRRPSASSAAGVPLPVYLRDRCPEPDCRAELPRGVNYCPRCGTRQKAQVNRVA